MSDKKIKPLCKWKKGQYKAKRKQFLKAVQPARYGCDKCGAVASAKCYLCDVFELDNG